MKKHLLSLVSLIIVCSTYATEYMTEDVSNWDIKPISGCVLDTSKAHELRVSGADDRQIQRFLEIAYWKYKKCFRNTELNYNEKKAMHLSNKYATELFAKIIKEEKHKDHNVVFSPTSMQFVLAMAANGTANNDTYAKITRALGKENISLDTLNEMYEKRMQLLLQYNAVDDTLSSIRIGIANTVFLQDNHHFGKDFLQSIEKHYNAAVNNVDFNNDSTIAIIDDWAKKATKGMIPSMGIQSNPDLKLVLSNALSFNSDWESKFSLRNTKSGKFKTSSGKRKIVKKMNGYKSGGYAKTAEYELAGLKLEDGYYVNVILPNVGISAESILSNIDLDNIQYDDPGPGYVYSIKLSLPKFKIDKKIPLNDALKENGLECVLTDKLDKIAKDVIIKDAEQSTHLEIDEDGVKASAITSFLVVGYGCPKYKIVEMDLNRPFIITIQNKKNHEILFIGLINDPTSKE